MLYVRSDSEALETGGTCLEHDYARAFSLISRRRSFVRFSSAEHETSEVFPSCFRRFIYFCAPPLRDKPPGCRFYTYSPGCFTRRHFLYDHDLKIFVVLKEEKNVSRNQQQGNACMHAYSTKQSYTRILPSLHERHTVCQLAHVRSIIYAKISCG